MAKEKVIGWEKWFDGTFENLNLCTEGGDTRVVLKDSCYYKDSRFNNLSSQVFVFKLSLNSNQSLRLKIHEYGSVRKPYIGVVFSDDIEERFISLDTFRSYPTLSLDNSGTGWKKRILQSYFGRDYTYEKMYLQLRDMKYQSFKLIQGRLCQINDIVYRDAFYITDNKTL
jgi:hypothetical protein